MGNLPRLDSESWRCGGCGDQMIGKRTPDNLCGPCIALRMAADDPAAVTSGGGWISGPSASVEDVEAGNATAGDVLVLDDGTLAEITVTAEVSTGHAIWWREHGGTGSGVMVRARSERLQRVVS